MKKDLLCSLDLGGNSIKLEQGSQELLLRNSFVGLCLLDDGVPLLL